MSWQDSLMTIAGIFFTYSLIPQVHKVVRNTELAKGISWQFLVTVIFGILLSTIVFVDLRLWWATFTNLIQLIGWLVILAIKMGYYHDRTHRFNV